MRRTRSRKWGTTREKNKTLSSYVLWCLIHGELLSGVGFLSIKCKKIQQVSFGVRFTFSAIKTFAQERVGFLPQEKTCYFPGFRIDTIKI